MTTHYYTQNPLHLLLFFDDVGRTKTTHPTICLRSSFLLSMSNRVCCSICFISGTVCTQNSSSVSFSTPPRIPPGLLPTGELRDLNTDRPGVRGELGPRPTGDAGSPVLVTGGGAELEKLWPKGSQLRGCE